MPHDPTDWPIEGEYQVKMKRLAKAIDQLFNDDKTGVDRTTGFVLMVFPFENAALCNYISNADRKDVIVMLEARLARFKELEDAEKKNNNLQ
jgi:hypothetical protein